MTTPEVQILFESTGESKLEIFPIKNLLLRQDNVSSIFCEPSRNSCRDNVDKVVFKDPKQQAKFDCCKMQRM